jgi:CRISPR-associated endonuclease/helicase Cas3
MNIIYAKSQPSDLSQPRETLHDHTFNLLSVFASLRQATPYLPDLCKQPQLFRDLFYAIYLHDLGKAATGFQSMLEGGDKWGYRHEILSAGFVHCLRDVDELSRKAIMLAVITHHRSVSALHEYSSVLNPSQWQSKRDELAPNWEQVQTWLRDLPNVASKYFGATLPTPSIPQSSAEVEDAFKRSAWAYKRTREDDDEDDAAHYALFTDAKLYAAMLRGIVITCDHLASGGHTQILSAVPDLVRRLKIGQPYPFQSTLGAQRGNVLLSAPTGAGKTEAALMWADAQQDSGRRLFYVLPYTASINAMLKRFEERYDLTEQVGALHGKANYFAYGALCERKYEPRLAAQQARQTQDLSRKIYRPIKILTPFQIIKAFFGVRGWEAQWSEFAGGVFIFDEIHVYDARTTALLLTALEQLVAWDARFLFMSATFPDFLKSHLRRVIPDLIELAPDSEEPRDKVLLETPRHQVRILDGEISEHLEAIRAVLRVGKSVLVVCNTVARAQQIFEQLRGDETSATLLHGRFILRDRERIEKELDEVRLLVGTQAVEVSLDLDFDTIFTEPAPIDALIQRFGRVNRRGTKGVVDVHICTQGSENDRYFYDSQRIERTLKVLCDGELLTQTFVSAAVDEVYKQGYNTKEQKIFDEVSQSFRHIIRGLVPFDDSERDEEFYDLIQSIQVVPVDFEGDFLSALNEGQFFEAMKFFATISLGQGMKLRNVEALSKRVHETERRKHVYHVAHVGYDPKLGVLLDQVASGSVILD